MNSFDQCINVKGSINKLTATAPRLKDAVAECGRRFACARGSGAESRLCKMGPTFSPVFDSVTRGVPVTVNCERLE